MKIKFNNLDEKYHDLTKLLNKMSEKVDLLTKNSKTKRNNRYEKNDEYNIISFMNNVWDDCIKRSKEILSKFWFLDLDKKITSLILEMINQNSDNDFENENIIDEYFEFPEELYDKEYEIKNWVYQSKKLKSWINEWLRINEETDMVNRVFIF